MVKLKLFTIASVVALSLAAFTGTYASDRGEDGLSGALRTVPVVYHSVVYHVHGLYSQYGLSEDEEDALNRPEALGNIASYSSMGEDSADGASWPKPIALLLAHCEYYAVVYDKFVLPHLCDEHPEAFARASASPTKTNDAPWPPAFIRLLARCEQEVAICEAQIAMTETPTKAWLELKDAQKQAAATCVQTIKSGFFSYLFDSVKGYRSELAAIDENAPANQPTIQRLKQTNAAMGELIGHLIADHLAEQSLVNSEAGNQAEAQNSG